MLIFSQNQKRIVNLDSIQEIEINGPGTWGQSFYSVDTYPLGEGDHNHIRLGKYQTEERAKEVLKEILIAYTRGKISEDGASIFGPLLSLPKDSIFEMPEE